jgi:hypothetical protein
MAHLEPDDRRRTADYIDRSDQSVGWAPLALLAAFLVLVGFLVFGTRWAPQTDRLTSNQRSELPNPGTGAITADASAANAPVMDVAPSLAVNLAVSLAELLGCDLG